MTERIPYARKEFKSNLSIYQEWKIFDGAQGCTPLNIDGFGLSMDRVPLPLHLPSSTPPSNPTIVPQPQAENPPRTEEPKGIKGWLARAAAKPVPPPAAKKGPVLIEAFKEAKEWMNATGADNRPKAEPFDMLDIPQGMAAMGFSKGRIFAERWFNGRAFTGPTSVQERAGAMYPKDMIDEKTTKISWLLGFDSVRKKYEELIENSIYSALSIQQVKKNIVRFMARNPRFYGTLHTNQHCKNDIQELHRQFQFQLNPINDLDTLEGFYPTDLTASLGSFNFFAAIATAEIITDTYNRYTTLSNSVHCTKSRATITHIWIYAKDSYSFQDDGKNSQYLGHWNRNGLVILPVAAGAGRIVKFIKDYTGSKVDMSFETGSWDVVSTQARKQISKLRESDIYTSVRNRDYIEWRKIHGRGGDFVIYSDLKKIQLDNPIFVSLEEIC